MSFPSDSRPILHPVYKYVDFCFKVLSKRYILDIAQIPAAIAKAKQALCARTWYRFPKTVKDADTVKKYKGSCVADYIPFDFDNKEDPEQAIEEARKFVASLEVTYEVKPKTLQFYFSGMKGIHVLIPAKLFGGFSPSSLLPEALKRVALDLIGELDADKSIYDCQHVLRCANTIHPDTGLFKIALTPQEFLNSTLEEIKELAKAPRTVELLPTEDLIPVPGLMEIYRKHISGASEKPASKILTSGELFRGGLSEGEGRDIAAFNIARYLRDQGMKPTGALQILRLWDSTNTDPLTETDGDGVLETKIGSAYGEIEGSRLTIDSIKNIGELAQSYTEYVESLKLKRIYLGFKKLDKATRGVSPGELFFLLARSSVGKSTFLQNIQAHLGVAQQPNLFVSLEQPLAQCFERAIQIATNFSGEEIENAWQTQTGRDEMISSSMTVLRYAYTIDIGLSVEGIEEAVGLAEEKAQMEMSCVLIDYLGYIDMPGRGSITERVSETARELKKMAKRINRAVICAAQVSRGSGEDGTKPLTISSARDSGAVEDSAEVLLGMYRKEQEPDIAYEGKIEWMMQILKNKKGHLGHIDMETDRRSLRMKEA